MAIRSLVVALLLSMSSAKLAGADAETETDSSLGWT